MVASFAMVVTIIDLLHNNDFRLTSKWKEIDEGLHTSNKKESDRDQVTDQSCCWNVLTASYAHDNCRLCHCHVAVQSYYLTEKQNTSILHHPTTDKQQKFQEKKNGS